MNIWRMHIYRCVSIAFFHADDHRSIDVWVIVQDGKSEVTSFGNILTHSLISNEPRLLLHKSFIATTSSRTASLCYEKRVYYCRLIYKHVVSQFYWYEGDDGSTQRVELSLPSAIISIGDDDRNSSILGCSATGYPTSGNERIPPSIGIDGYVVRQSQKRDWQYLDEIVAKVVVEPAVKKGIDAGWGHLKEVTNGVDDEHFLLVFRVCERVVKIEDQIKDVQW